MAIEPPTWAVKANGEARLEVSSFLEVGGASLLEFASLPGSFCQHLWAIGSHMTSLIDVVASSVSFPPSSHIFFCLISL